MKDKLSKVKNLVKKYGLTGTIKKMTGYIYSKFTSIIFFLFFWHIIYLFQLYCADFDERENLCGIE